MKTENYSKIIKAFFFFFFSFASIIDIQSQDLTKEETVNYINKKLNETTNHYLTQKWNDEIGDLTLYYYSSNFELKGDKIIYTRFRGTHKERQYGKSGWITGVGTRTLFPCTYNEITEVFSFAPEKILSIEKFDDIEYGDNPVGSIMIKIPKNTGILKRNIYEPTAKATDERHFGFCLNYEYTHETFSMDNIFISYLKGDDFNKIKKALEYLRDLAKAEDDPFGD